MQVFKNCFLGIPLPKYFEPEFAQLISEIRKICPDASTVHPETPHITLYYLYQQTQKDITQILDIVDENKELLRDTSIKNKALDTFVDDVSGDPRVLYISLETSYELNQFQAQLSRELNQFNPSDRKIFTPHITLARFKNLKSISQLKLNKNILNNMSKNINWEFPITEISFFAKKDDDEQKIHHKIGTVRL